MAFKRFGVEMVVVQHIRNMVGLMGDYNTRGCFCALEVHLLVVRDYFWGGGCGSVLGVRGVRVGCESGFVWGGVVVVEWWWGFSCGWGRMGGEVGWEGSGVGSREVRK